MLGREVVYADKTHNSPHILLEDGLKLEFDSLILATGVVPEIRSVKGLQNKENVTLMNSIDTHKKVRKYLEKAKTITVLGNNLRAMECVSTIRREYPNMTIYVVDENEEPVIQSDLGKDIYDNILDLALDNKIKFVVRNPLDEIIGEGDVAKKLRFRSGL